MTPEPEPAPPPIVDLLRHGSVRGGTCLRGWQDDPLDEAGWRQMRSAVNGRVDWQRVLSSPLQRCAAFARDLATGLTIPVDTDPRWRELGFGDWEGRTADEVLTHDPDALQRFWQDPAAHPPPNGETLVAFEARVDAAWAALQHGLRAGERVLLITHGGVIRLLLCRVLGLPINEQFRVEVPHATLVTLVLDRQQPRLRLGQALSP